MASIRRRGASWQARVTRSGFFPFVKTFTSKLQAEQWARAQEHALDLQSCKGGIPAKGLTLGDLLRRAPGAKNIYLNSQKIAQLVADGTQVEERSVRRSVNEDVQITFVCVRPVHHRTKYACIDRPVCQDYFANFTAMRSKCFRGFHFSGLDLC